jgi:hypothetical protein
MPAALGHVAAADLPLPGPGPADEPLALSILNSQGSANPDLENLGIREVAVLEGLPRAPG